MARNAVTLVLLIVKLVIPMTFAIGVVSTQTLLVFNPQSSGRQL